MILNIIFRLGLAIHNIYRYLFVADDQGNITELMYPSSFLSFQSKATFLVTWELPIEVQDHAIKDISVDWLYNCLYLLLESVSSFGKWQVARSEFGGRGFRSVIKDINYKPFHIEVDPFNGLVLIAKLCTEFVDLVFELNVERRVSVFQIPILDHPRSQSWRLVPIGFVRP